MKPHKKPTANFNTQAAGHALMTLPWNQGIIDIPIIHILDIMYNSSREGDSYIVKINITPKDDYRKYSGHYRFEDFSIVVYDMYRRALQGDNADFRDYNNDGTLKLGFRDMPHRQMAQEETAVTTSLPQAQEQQPPSRSAPLGGPGQPRPTPGGHGGGGDF